VKYYRGDDLGGNVSPELWMGIQADCDRERARARSEAEISRRVQPMKPAEPVPP
jgi:plasmid maintenance system antidote protein VapI